MVSSQENHLSPGFSEWHRGGGSSPSMGKSEEEEAALCDWSMKKKWHERLVQSPSRTTKKKRKRKYVLQGGAFVPCRGIFGKGRGRSSFGTTFQVFYFLFLFFFIEAMHLRC